MECSRCSLSNGQPTELLRVQQRTPLFGCSIANFTWGREFRGFVSWRFRSRLMPTSARRTRCDAEGNAALCSPRDHQK